VYIKNKIKRNAAVAASKAGTSPENSLFREGEAARLRHEKLTGIDRAKWDQIIERRIEALKDIQVHAVEPYKPIGLKGGKLLTHES